MISVPVSYTLLPRISCVCLLFSHKSRVMNCMSVQERSCWNLYKEKKKNRSVSTQTSPDLQITKPFDFLLGFFFPIWILLQKKYISAVDRQVSNNVDVVVCTFYLLRVMFPGCTAPTPVWREWVPLCGKETSARRLTCPSWRSVAWSWTEWVTKGIFIFYVFTWQHVREGLKQCLSLPPCSGESLHSWYWLPGLWELSCSDARPHTFCVQVLLA